MPNERLSLQIDGKATGTAEIEKLAASLNKVVDISAKIGQPKQPGEVKTGFENFPAQIKSLVEDPLSSAQSMVGKFASSFGPVGLIASGAVAGLAAFAVASESASRSLADLGVSVRDISLKTGLSVTEVGRFGFAARLVGQDVSVFETGMRKLSQALADNGPEGDKARKGLSDLGVKTREINGDLKPTSSIFEQIAVGLGRMGSAAERNAEVIKIFGRGGIELIPVLDKLNEKLAKAAESHAGLTESDVARYEKLKQRLVEVDTLWEKIGKRLKDGLAGEVWIDIKQTGGKLILDFLGGNIAKGQEGTSHTGRGNFGPVTGTAGGKLQPFLSFARDLESGAAANTRISGDETAFGRTLAGAEALSSKAKSAAEAARTGYFGLKEQGVGVSAVEEARTKWVEAEAAAKKYEDRVKSIRQSEAALENEAMTMKRFEDMANRLGGVDQSPEAKLRGQYTSDLAAINADKTTPRARARGRSEAYTGYLQGLAGLQRNRSEEMESIGIESLSKSAELFKTYGAELAAGFRESLTQGDIVGRTPLQAAALTKLPKLVGPTSQDLLKDLAQNTGHLERMAQIAGGPGDEVATQQKLSDIRQDAADRELQLHRSLANLKLIDAQALEDAELDHERKITEVRQGNIEMLAQLRKEQLDREVNMVTGLARAALGGGKSIASYAKDTALSTGETVLSNYLKSNPAALDKIFPHAAEGSKLGGLFKGTVFGPNANDASITSVTLGNTNETRLNTIATENLTSAVTSMSGGVAGTAVGTATGTGGFSIPGLSTFGSDTGGFTGRTLADMPLNDTSALDAVSQGGFSPDASSISSARSAFSTGGSKGLLGMAGKGAAAGAGIFQAVQGFSEGGARNIASGIGGTLASGTAVASMFGPAGAPVAAGLAIAAGVADIASMMFPDPKKLRQEFITKALGNAKYEAPTALDVSMGVGGGYSDYSAFGDVRSSNLSPYPTGVTQPTQWYRGGSYTPIPGSSGTPYGAPIVQMTINALDSQSIMDRGADIANALVPQFGTHTGLALAATKATLGG